MKCSVCQQTVDRSSAHCLSKTCTWCRACVEKKHAEADVKPPKGLSG